MGMVSLYHLYKGEFGDVLLLFYPHYMIFKLQPKGVPPTNMAVLDSAVAPNSTASFRRQGRLSKRHVKGIGIISTLKNGASFFEW